MASDDEMARLEAKMAEARAKLGAGSVSAPVPILQATKVRKAKANRLRMIGKGNNGGGDDLWSIRCSSANRERVKALSQETGESISSLMDRAMQLLFADQAKGASDDN